MSVASQTAPGGRRRVEGLGYWLNAQRGLLFSIVAFVVLFAVYGWAQPVGLTSNVINTAANNGAILALVAMAQTIPVLTGGIDLSVGMVFVLANCLASNIVVGSPF